MLMKKMLNANLLQSCLTLWDPMDYSTPGSSVHGISQARILEWVAISFSRGSSQPRYWTCICLCLLHWRQILYPLRHLGSSQKMLKPLITRETEIRTTMRYCLTLVRWPLFKSLQITNAGEGVEKREPSHNVACMHAKSLQSCTTLCDPLDYSLPGSSAHGILQARILEWVVMPASRGSSWHRDWTGVPYVSALAGRFFTTSTTLEASYTVGENVNWCSHYGRQYGGS